MTSSKTGDPKKIPLRRKEKMKRMKPAKLQNESQEDGRPMKASARYYAATPVKGVRPSTEKRWMDAMRPRKGAEERVRPRLPNRGSRRKNKLCAKNQRPGGEFNDGCKTSTPTGTRPQGRVPPRRHTTQQPRPKVPDGVHGTRYLAGGGGPESGKGRQDRCRRARRKE